MEISSSLIAQAYADTREATAPAQGRTPLQAFGSTAEDFVATLRESETVAMDAMTRGADPHAMVQALAQTELAVETAVMIRNRVVEAYQEILRMPV